jgi:Family of unknown function (DUF6455)
MIGFAEHPKAWWLTRGMARLTGLNLPGAVVEGWLQPREVAALVTRCAACGRDGECAPGLDVARSIPAYCPNKPGIEALGG